MAFLQSAPGLAFLHRVVLGIHLVCPEVGACGMRLVCLLLTRTGLDRFGAASYGTQQQGNRQVEEALVTYRQEASARLATDRSAKVITWATDETFTGGLCRGAAEPQSPSLVLEQAVPGRDQDTWHTLMEKALAGLTCQGIPSTSDAAPGLLAYVEPHLGAHPAPALFDGQHELGKAVCGPMATTQRAAAKAARKAQEQLAPVPGHRQGTGAAPHKRGPGRPPQAAVCLEPVAQDAPAARQEFERLSAPREQVTQRIRTIAQAYHVVDVERGVRRNGRLMAAEIRQQMDPLRNVAQPEGPRQACLERSEKAERGGPTMPATIACVAGSVQKQVRQLDVSPPRSSALHAHLLPSFSRERVAQSCTVPAGAPLQKLAERLRPPLFAPGGALAELREGHPGQRNQQTKELAEVFQRSSSNVDGRHGSLSLRNHQLRGLARPRKRAWLTAIHNFFLTRADGATAAERFCGQKPRSMFAAILASVDLPPAPLRPPRRAAG